MRGAVHQPEKKGREDHVEKTLKPKSMDFDE